MKLSSAIKPISYVKAHASEIVKELAEGHGPLVVTQNGEAKVVIQSVADYERTQASLAMFKILAMSEQSAVRHGALEVDEAFASIRTAIADRRKSREP